MEAKAFLRTRRTKPIVERPDASAITGAQRPIRQCSPSRCPLSPPCLQEFARRDLIEGREHGIEAQCHHACQHVPPVARSYGADRKRPAGRAGCSPLGSGACAPAFAASRPPSIIRCRIGSEGKRAKRYSILSRRKPRKKPRLPGESQ